MFYKKISVVIPVTIKIDSITTTTILHKNDSRSSS
jgi:hypothetical protein